MTRRDSYLDYWRGSFQVLMLVDHLPFLFPGIFPLITGLFELFGYVSVAEGFVFLSGYVSGLVYSRVRQEAGALPMWRKAFGRAATIYFTYVAAVVLLIVTVKLLGMANVSWGGWRHLFEIPLSSAVIEIAGLLWQPSFLEILPMYSLFMLFTPLIIVRLDRNWCWLIIGASALIWLANQFGMRGKLQDVAGLESANFGYFNFFGWQILFVSGIVCGHRTYQVDRPWLPKNMAVSWGACALAVFFFAWHHKVLEIPLSGWWVERSSLGPLRLVNFFCLAFLAARFRNQIGKIIGWKGLSFLSRHSLQVFAFHLIPVYIGALFVAGKTQLDWWEQLLFIGLCVFGLYYIAWLSELVKRWFCVLWGKLVSPQVKDSEFR
jgi:hypothetical protein